GKHRAPEGETTEFEAATSALPDVTGDYAVDVAHTRIGIRARHAMVTTVRGSFSDFEGAARLDTANPAASSVALRIRTATLDTGGVLVSDRIQIEFDVSAIRVDPGAGGHDQLT